MDNSSDIITEKRAGSRCLGAEGSLNLFVFDPLFHSNERMGNPQGQVRYGTVR